MTGLFAASFKPSTVARSASNCASIFLGCFAPRGSCTSIVVACLALSLTNSVPREASQSMLEISTPARVWKPVSEPFDSSDDIAGSKLIICGVD